MILDEGRIIEFDRCVSVLKIQGLILTGDNTPSPSVLLHNPASRFYSFCKATGKEEFAMLRKIANMSESGHGSS
jgi:hypothetical protein